MKKRFRIQNYCLAHNHGFFMWDLHDVELDRNPYQLFLSQSFMIL